MKYRCPRRNPCPDCVGSSNDPGDFYFLKSGRRKGQVICCKPCANECHRRWRVNPDSKARIKAYNDRWHAKNPGRRKVSCRRWRAKNPERYQAGFRRQKMQRLCARPSWVNGEVDSVYAERDRRNALGEQLRVDHFWPLQPRKQFIEEFGLVRPFTGLDVPWNLRLVPHSENAAKSNIRPDVSYSKREFKRIKKQLNRR